MEFISHDEFRRCVQRYDGNRGVRRLSCWNQFLAMAFAQLTYRHSLRDIEVCLRAQRSKLYHCGFKSPVRRSTLADANERRDWRIYADFARTLIDIARPLYADTDLGLDLEATVYALDATTIDLCLSVFPWASYKRAKGAIKLHTLMEVHSSIPVFIDITHAKVHDIHLLDVIVPEPGSFLVMDRAYIDFARLYALHQALAFFVVRAKQNFQFRRRTSQTVDRLSGLRSDPNRFTHRTSQSKALSHPASKDQLLFRTNRSIPGLFNQQLFHRSADRSSPLPLSLANRTLLQMDQTTLTNQTFLWYLTQQRQMSNLDCRSRLRADCDHQKEAWPTAKSLHHTSGPQPDSVRKKLYSVSV